VPRRAATTSTGSAPAGIGGSRLEQLALDAVAEVLVLLEPTLDDLRRQAAFALERAPAG
jgi:hypothetical protein